MTSFFVDPSKGIVQPPEVAGWDAAVAAQPRLGRVERTCNACAKEWGPTRCTDPRCDGIVFTDREVPAVPFMTRLVELVKPAKTARATGAHKKAISHLQASVTQLLVDLRVLDVQLRDAVRADVLELCEAQGIVHAALSISGDASPDRVAGLSLSLTAIAASLNLAIEHLEAKNPK